MKEKVNIGIAGCGVHAQIAHIPVFKKLRDCNLIAVCDTDTEKLERVANKYNIPRRYSDFQEMIEDEEINAVVIATPNYLHMPMTVAALKYGKDVLCENPMAINLKEAQDILKVSRQTGKKVAVALTGRFRPDVQTLKKFIKEGELGDIYYLKAGWLLGMEEWILSDWRMDLLKSGGGAFLTLGSQVLAIALYFLEEKEPDTIFGSLHKKEPGVDVEDTAMCIINYKDGTLLTIEVGWSLLFDKDFLYCNIFGKRGGALLNPLKIHKELHDELVNVTPSIPAKNLYKVACELQAQLFIDSIRKNTSPPFTAEDGLLIARITNAFYESAKKNKMIKI
ncbi:MAG: Gfo/Idh/MocA family oxidoreductase [candidate division WOR-3 bacterium]|nr:Gfo/Idh/MocA family oxidoreductase [candidate division WOR-3 bacterium]